MSDSVNAAADAAPATSGSQPAQEVASAKAAPKSHTNPWNQGAQSQGMHENLCFSCISAILFVGNIVKGSRLGLDVPSTRAIHEGMPHVVPQTLDRPTSQHVIQARYLCPYFGTTRSLRATKAQGASGHAELANS